MQTWAIYATKGGHWITSLALLRGSEQDAVAAAYELGCELWAEIQVRRIYGGCEILHLMNRMLLRQ